MGRGDKGVTDQVAVRISGQRSPPQPSLRSTTTSAPPQLARKEQKNLGRIAGVFVCGCVCGGGGGVVSSAGTRQRGDGVHTHLGSVPWQGSKEALGFHRARDPRLPVFLAKGPPATTLPPLHLTIPTASCHSCRPPPQTWVANPEAGGVGWGKGPPLLPSGEGGKESLLFCCSLVAWQTLSRVQQGKEKGGEGGGEGRKEEEKKKEEEKVPRSPRRPKGMLPHPTDSPWYPPVPVATETS